MADNLVRCPSCRSTYISLTEVMEEWGSTDFVTLAVNDEGAIDTQGAARIFSAGDIIKTRLTCGDCDHEWTPRRRVAA